jgi:hypothetical protein
MRRLFLVGAAVFLAQSVSAQVTTISGSFSASNWSVQFGSPSAPINPTFLNYSVTFDLFTTYAQDSAPLTIFSTNVPYDIKFSYDSGSSAFVLATNGLNGGCSIAGDSFCAIFASNGNGVPIYVGQGAGAGGWFANRITNLSAVPEPDSWVMLIAGFGLTGAISRRRRASAAG